MLAPPSTPGISLRVEPDLAEAAVFAALRRREAVDPGAILAHRARTEPIYGLADAAERDEAFGRQAVHEFELLRLALPVVEALGERPALSARLRVVLLATARGRHDEGVTCEPGGEHLGVRLEAARFDDAAGLLAWARHVLGHAEDTLDPEFGFEPGWNAPGGGRAVAAPAQARLHRLWDVGVDGRLAADGRLPDALETFRRHRAALAAELPGLDGAAVDALAAQLWSGPRPSFGDLLAWAARPARLVSDLLPGLVVAARPDRCPLCGFPGLDVVTPDGEVSAAVAADYPAWRPADGLCSRCTDRYRLVDLLGGGS